MEAGAVIAVLRVTREARVPQPQRRLKKSTWKR